VTVKIENNNQPIDVSILRAMCSNRNASVFSPGHFDGLDNAAAIRNALSQLVKAGTNRDAFDRGAGISILMVARIG
jgi:hypothetical protein